MRPRMPVTAAPGSRVAVYDWTRSGLPHHRHQLDVPGTLRVGSWAKRSDRRPRLGTRGIMMRLGVAETQGGRGGGARYLGGKTIP